MSVVNRISPNVPKIEFISYDGKYPNLCRGVLTLKIGNEIVKFGHHHMNNHWDDVKNKWIYTDEDPDNPNYKAFWSSGGSCRVEKNYMDSHVLSSEWEIDVDELPEKFWNYADEFDRIINENIPQGCCGGCL